MEELTTAQQKYIEDWRDNYRIVLSSISLEDLDAIAPFIEVRIGRGWWNEEVYIYNTAAEAASNDQLAVMLKHDTEGQIEVSNRFNELLVRAIRAGNKDLIKSIVHHPHFEYPGTGTHNRYFRDEDLTPMRTILKGDSYRECCFENDKEMVRYAYTEMSEKWKMRMYCDFFRSVAALERYEHFKDGTDYILA